MTLTERSARLLDRRDKHLLNLEKVGPIPIVKVADFLELFERQQGQNGS